MKNDNDCEICRKYHHYIYKITFLKGDVQGRYYLGKRTYFGRDITLDSYTGSGNFCIAYFKKYGAILNETYIKEVIEINDSVKSNRDRELIIIGNLWKTDPLCMNQCPGGSGTPDHDTLCHVQDKYKKDIAQYDLYGNFIRSWHGIREAARELGINRTGIQDCLSNRKPTAFGYQWKYYSGTEEPISPCFKIDPIIQYTKSGDFVAEFESPHAAEIEIGVDAGSIKENCLGNRLTAGGYVWRFKQDPFDRYRLTIDRSSRKGIYKERKISQYDKDGNFIKTWINAHEAVKELGFKESAYNSICAVARGTRKTAQGFIWKYLE